MILGPVGDRTGWMVEGAVALFLVVFPLLLGLFGAGTDLGTRILILGLFGLGVDLIFGSPACSRSAKPRFTARAGS